VGAADSCMKHENMQGSKFCTDVANSSMVVRPNFSQLFHRSKRLRIAARVPGDRTPKAKRFWSTPSRYALVGTASLTKYSDMSRGVAVFGVCLRRRRGAQKRFSGIPGCFIFYGYCSGAPWRDARNPNLPLLFYF
jgi:hypothetical protein